MGALVSLKNICDDDFEVEYEIFPSVDVSQPLDEVKQKIYEGLKDIDSQIEINQEKIDDLNAEIEKLTNHADTFDYLVAVASGILTGLIDSFVVGEFDFKSAKAKSNKQINSFIMKYAKMKGYKGGEGDEGERLKSAISFLEKKYPVPQDNIWSGGKIGVTSKSHHLDDLAHHPTLLGLVSAIVVQFFRFGTFINQNGEWHLEFVNTEPKELIKIWLPAIISGLLNWFVYMVEAKNEDKMDEEIPKPIRTIVKMLANAPVAVELYMLANDKWISHLVSDMGGSKNTAGGGMGIPGIFLSLLKEISSLPIVKDTGLPKIVNDLYTKQHFDMRSELAVLNELGRQAIPVLIGEVLVRGFYFVRHLAEEVREHKNLKEVDWNKVIPFGNRTIARMLTISSGTFMAVDMADAAIRSAADPKSATVPEP